MSVRGGTQPGGEQERGVGACVVCWTCAWAPCPEGTEDAVPDPLTGGWMVCQMCNADRWLAESRAALAAAEARADEWQATAEDVGAELRASHADTTEAAIQVIEAAAHEFASLGHGTSAAEYQAAAQELRAAVGPPPAPPADPAPGRGDT